ncbi:hypothetical protein GCM10010411_76120 [Actinomadura fulvescens]|uniref:Prevent-host-death family protein n=1 Tax=Actinomadura fulvescens TaxID=46160 RepID=A0ABP6CVV1_9ACTN
MLTVANARIQLPKVLKTFREKGATAEPVIVGAHRVPEAVFMSFALFQQVASASPPLQVLTVGVARDQLSKILMTFRELSDAADPVAVGAGRRGKPPEPEGVLVSFERYTDLADAVDEVLSAPELKERLTRLQAKNSLPAITIEQLAARIGIDLPEDLEGRGEADS